MNPRKSRSNKPLADPNQPLNGRRSDPGPSAPSFSSSKGKNPRKRSSPESDDDACAAAPPKKRVSSRRPPSTAHPSPVVKRTATRRSTRKVARSPRREVPRLADPNPDVVVIDDDGYPYVVYDNAPHLHPPPQRYKQNDAHQSSTPPVQVKGCSIKPCWTLTQQRRCRILQTDEAVEEIGWKKVRKWMQAVRCRLCGETQVLRDLTKGCFNLEHWWRHLRVRHGMKREEEIEEKGEEKYKMLPIKDHVCVGACSTCGEAGAVVPTRQQNTSTTAESSDLSSLPSSLETTLRQPRQPEAMPSTPRVEPLSPGHAPRAGPNNASNPTSSQSLLYTLANARPSVTTPTSLPIAGSRDIPPLVPQSWAEFIDPTSDLPPHSPLPAPQRPGPSRHNLGTPTPQVQQIRPPLLTYTIPSLRLPPAKIAPPVACSECDAAEALLALHAFPNPTFASKLPAWPSTTHTTHTRPEFRPISQSALPLLTPSPTVGSASQPPSASPETTPRDGPPQSHFARTTAAAPSLADYRWPPANNVPAGAPSPPCMTVASWEENDAEDDVDEVREPLMLDPPRNVRTPDARVRTEDGVEDHVMGNGREASARVLHHVLVSASEDREMVDGPLVSAHGLVLRPQSQTAARANEAGPPYALLQPGWVFIKQEEFEPDMDGDEDSDMVDQLLGDN